MQRVAPTLIVLAAALTCGAAQAQFGAFNLPSGDFAWQWGNPERLGRFHDFSINGSEADFRCELTGKLSAGSRMSQVDVRQMESDLASSLYFIEQATNTMNVLDQQRELDWAALNCVKAKPREPDAEKRKEIEDKARAKAVEKMLKRRARREKEEQE